MLSSEPATRAAHRTRELRALLSLGLPPAPSVTLRLTTAMTVTVTIPKLLAGLPLPGPVLGALDDSRNTRVCVLLFFPLTGEEMDVQKESTIS